MRVGDFSVEVVPHGGGRVRELDSGHVLARPGLVYRLRLRNSSPLNCVVDVDIDGTGVTGGGLVLAPWSTTDLERPMDGEDGRFTVIAEGNEAVFGPDGGRDNPDLGLIEASFRRELPRREHRTDLPPIVSPLPSFEPPSRPRPISPARFNSLHIAEHLSEHLSGHLADDLDALVVRETDGPFERAAGTGLTGHSDQRFVPVSLGPLEPEATVIQLRLVIGTQDALADDAPRPLVERSTPVRPAARP